MKVAFVVVAFLTRRPPVSQRKKPYRENKSGIPDELNVDFSTLYNVDQPFSQDEALKAGIQLTKRMRQVQVDHDKEVSDIDHTIAKLQKRRKYVNLAYECLSTFTSTGELYLTDDEEETMPEILEDLDITLMDACLSKYGLKSGDVTIRQDYRGDKEWTFVFELSNIDDVEPEDCEEVSHED